LPSGRVIKDGDIMAKLIYKFITDASIKQVNENERSFTAWASRSSIDRDDEEIDASGWITKDYRKNPIVPLFHDYWQFPVAKSLWEKAEPKDNPIGLMFKPQFAETMLGMETFYLYKEGFMNAFSVGFDPMEWMDSDGELHSREKDGEFGIWQKGYIEQKKKKPRCKFLKQVLLEISGVLVPAHPDALVETRSHIKSPELTKYIDDMINKSRKPMISFTKANLSPDQISDIWKKSTEIQTIMKEVGMKLGYVVINPNRIEVSDSEYEPDDVRMMGAKPDKQKDADVIDSQDFDDGIIDDDNIDLDELLGSDGDALADSGDISEVELVEMLAGSGDDAVDFNLEDY
jgi:phage head maturation protease